MPDLTIASAIPDAPPAGSATGTKAPKTKKRKRKMTPVRRAFAPDEWVTIAEASAAVPCHPSFTRREIKLGRLRSVRLGGGRLIRIKGQWITEWMEAGEVTRPPARGLRVAKGPR